MRTWIFQGNPEVFDIEGYLAASSGLITWTVARYADQISPGDTAYICDALNAKHNIAHAYRQRLSLAGSDHQLDQASPGWNGG